MKKNVQNDSVTPRIPKIRSTAKNVDAEGNRISVFKIRKGWGDKRSAENDLLKRTQVPFSFSRILKLCADFGVCEESLRDFAEAYTELYRTHSVRGEGKMVIRWIGVHLDKFQMAVPNWAVRLIIDTLATIMPQPVHLIRNAAVHATPEQAMDENIHALLRVAMLFCTPIGRRKIANFEGLITGRTFSREMYRSSDMGQHGRLFSDSDITDILNRAFLITFQPLFIRTVPITDRGLGRLVLTNCTATVEQCKHVMEENHSFRSAVQTEMRLLRRLHDPLCSEKRRAKIQAQLEHLYTMTDEQAAYIPPTTKRNNRTVFRILFTCNDTGEQYETFTRHIGKAERLSRLTSLSGEVIRIPETKVSEGLFGRTVTQIPGEVRVKTVRPYRVQGRYFSALSMCIQGLHRYLHRRPEDADPIITEHRDSVRYRPANEKSPIALDDILSLGLIASSTEQAIIETEMIADSDLPQYIRPDSRRVHVFNEIRGQLTSKPSTIGRREYSRMKERMFSEFAERVQAYLDFIENQKPEQPAPAQMDRGFVVRPIQAEPLRFPKIKAIFDGETKIVGAVERCTEDGFPYWETNTGHTFCIQDHDAV